MGNDFDDADALGTLLTDGKSADTLAVSQISDAHDVISSLRDATDDSPWTSLDRAEVATRLDALIDDPRQVQQGGLNLCGPAVFFVHWIKRDPVAFANYAASLFNSGSGSIGSLNVKPNNDLLRADYAGMASKMAGSVCPQADWMVLGALRNSTDVFWQGSFAGNPDQQLSAMTRPAEVAAWFQATGIYRKVDNQANWLTPAGIPHATNLSTAEGVDTAVLINVNLLAAAGRTPWDRNWLMSRFPGHWVMLIGEVSSDLQTKDVLLSLWSWGQSLTSLKVPQQDFIDNYYGAVIATLKT